MKFIIETKPATPTTTAAPQGARRKLPLERAAEKARAASEDPAEKAAKVVETAVERMAKIDPEMAEKKRFLRDQVAQQKAKLDAQRDTEHWFCVNAESRAQKDALLKAFGLYDTGDKYLSALDVAALIASLLDAPDEERAAAVTALDALLTEPAPTWSKAKQSRRLAELTRL